MHLLHLAGDRRAEEICLGIKLEYIASGHVKQTSNGDNGNDDSDDGRVNKGYGLNSWDVRVHS